MNVFGAEWSSVRRRPLSAQHAHSRTPPGCRSGVSSAVRVMAAPLHLPRRADRVSVGTKDAAVTPARAEHVPPAGTEIEVRHASSGRFSRAWVPRSAQVMTTVLMVMAPTVDDD
jgi:hypothetical protein